MNQVTQIRSEWIAVSLRWVFLLLAIALVFTTGVPLAVPVPALATVFGLALVATFVLTALVFLKVGGQWVGWSGVALDALTIIVAGVATGGAEPLIIWLGLFPVITAALLPQWWAGLIVAVLLPLLAGVNRLIVEPENTLAAGTELVFTLVIFVLLALLVGWLHATLLAGTNRRGRAQHSGRYRVPGQMRDVQTLRGQARVIYEMAGLVSASLDYKRVLDAALGLGQSGVQVTAGKDADDLVSAVLLFEGDDLHVSTFRRFSAADSAVVSHAREGVLGEVMANGDPELVTEPFRDPELSRYQAFRTCRSAMVVPLRVGYETFGMVVYAHPRPKFFNRDRFELLQAICNQAIVALQNAQLYQDLRDEKERLVEVEEEARKKLARDLHDGPTQQVAAIAMRTNFIRRLVERDPKQAVEELYKVEELARRTTKEIRQMLFTLRPLILESQGLVAALQSLADKMKENHNQNVIVQDNGNASEKLDKQQQGVLFYIVEEAINNARKHAQAEHIYVRLRTEGPEMLRLEIQDDGVGFNVGEVDASYEQRSSLGMVNMRERAELISGSIRIDSIVGRGTKITVRVPLTESAKEKLHALA